MNAGDDHLHYQGELAAYLLDALSARERAEFEHHLERCERCRSEARWLGAAVDVLPSSVPQLEAPPELRERLVETMRREARGEEPVRASTARPRWSWLLRPATVLGATALIAAGAIGYILGNGGGGGGGKTTVQANATPVEPSAKATIERTGDSGILRVDRLPVQRSSHVYEVWVRRGEELKPSALFVVRRDGTGDAAIPSGLDGASEVMVTLEPDGGSAMPTTQPVLRAEV